MKIVNTHYTYVLLDPRKPGYFRYGYWVFYFEPFYVGKGTGDRCFKHLKASSKSLASTPKYNKIRKIVASGHEPYIRIVKKGLSDLEAQNLEKRLISRIGRIFSSEGSVKGPLVNLTDGGEGHSGHVHSKTQKNKIAKAVSKSWLSRSSESRKASLANLQKICHNTMSAEARKKLSSIVEKKWESLSIAQRKNLCIKMSIGMKEYYSNRSLEQKVLASEARRRSWETRRSIYGIGGRS